MDSDKLSKLKIIYIDSASRHGEANKEGKYRSGNKFADTLFVLNRNLRSSEEGRLLLKDLMYHNNISVRSWAAYSSLPFFTAEAIDVLKKIIKDDNYESFNCEITLNEWKKGNLKRLKEEASESDKKKLEKILSGKVITNYNDGEIYEQITSKITNGNIEDQVVKMSMGRQMIFLTISLEDEVNNGGFNQFFWNYTVSLSQIALKGYELIGAINLAKIVNEAINIYSEELPKNYKSKKKNSTNSFDESYSETQCGKLDEKFLELVKTENPTKLRIAYIKSHKDEFVEA